MDAWMKWFYLFSGMVATADITGKETGGQVLRTSLAGRDCPQMQPLWIQGAQRHSAGWGAALLTLFSYLQHNFQGQIMAILRREAPMNSSLLSQSWQSLPDRTCSDWGRWGWALTQSVTDSTSAVATACITCFCKSVKISMVASSLWCLPHQSIAGNGWEARAEMLEKDQNVSLDENIPEGDCITHAYSEVHSKEVYKGICTSACWSDSDILQGIILY